MGITSTFDYSDLVVATPQPITGLLADFICPGLGVCLSSYFGSRHGINWRTLGLGVLMNFLYVSFVINFWVWTAFGWGSQPIIVDPLGATALSISLIGVLCCGQVVGILIWLFLAILAFMPSLIFLLLATAVFLWIMYHEYLTFKVSRERYFDI